MTLGFQQSNAYVQGLEFTEAELKQLETEVNELLDAQMRMCVTWFYRWVS
jgi:hypothetical protein